PFRKSNCVAALVAIRPPLALLRRSLPLVKVVTPDVCHESALVLLKVELDAPERSMRPVIRPALFMVIAPVPPVTAAIATSEIKRRPEETTPVALLLSVTPPPAELRRITASPVPEPVPLVSALLLTTTVPVPEDATIPDPPVT